MPIRIVTDSSCDLPQELVTRHGITVVPLYINIGTQSYRDGVDMSREAFYEGLPDFPSHPSTAVPGVQTFVEAYERSADEGATEVLSIHIASSLSGMIDVARLAAREVRRVPVTVYDSGQLTLGVGLLVLAAARAAEQGLTVPDILALLDDQASRTYCFAVLDTLEFLRRSGRLSRFQSSLGAVLQIKPLLKMHRGEFDMERVRTNNGAHERLLELTSQVGPIEELALVHTHAPDKAAALAQKAQHLLSGSRVTLSAEVTPVIGAHIGPGAAGFVCITSRDRK